MDMFSVFTLLLFMLTTADATWFCYDEYHRPVPPGQHYVIGCYECECQPFPHGPVCWEQPQWPVMPIEHVRPRYPFFPVQPVYPSPDFMYPAATDIDYRPEPIYPQRQLPYQKPEFRPRPSEKMRPPPIVVHNKHPPTKIVHPPQDKVHPPKVQIPSILEIVPQIEKVVPPIQKVVPPVDKIQPTADKIPIHPPTDMLPPPTQIPTDVEVIPTEPVITVVFPTDIPPFNFNPVKTVPQ